MRWLVTVFYTAGHIAHSSVAVGFINIICFLYYTQRHGVCSLVCLSTTLEVLKKSYWRRALDL